MRGPLQHENTHYVSQHMRAHTHIYIYARKCTCTHRRNICIFPLYSTFSPFASPAVIDVLSYSVQHKLRHHGYSYRDVPFPGAGQYLNNSSLNNPTNHTHTLPVMHSPSCMLCLVQLAMLRETTEAACITKSLAGVFALPARTPDSAQSLENIETWHTALWVKDLQQWRHIGKESKSLKAKLATVASYSGRH